MSSAHAAECDPERREPLIRVVGAQPQPVLRAGREHAVGLGDALRHEIIDHHAEIAVGAAELKTVAWRRTPSAQH